MSETQLAQLNPGDRLEGQVASIELAGAFIDIGAEVNGFVHLSGLKPRKVNRVDEVLQVGQQVEVWVSSVDPEAERLELTMIRPVDLKWEQIEPGMVLTGKVVRLENFGAFVDVGAERHGLVHVSEMSAEYVRDPREVVSVGSQVEVSVLEVDRKKKQIRLSMKAVADELDFELEDEEELPTAMELALRKAMEGPGKQRERSEESAERAEQAQREQQDDLLSRTLSERVETSETSNRDAKEKE